MTFIRVRPIVNATETFTMQMSTSLRPLRPEISVRRNASRIANSTSGTASAFNMRMTSIPSAPSSALPSPKRIGLVPNTTPKIAPRVTPRITCT